MPSFATAFAVVLLLTAGCKKSEDRPSAGATVNVAPPADVGKPPTDAARTAHGVFYKWLGRGQGTEHPSAADVVVVSYTGWTTAGEMIDTSTGHGPASLPLGAMIPGWIEGLQLMVVGDKARFWIPEELAYAGRPGRPAGMLVFDVELVDFVRAPLRRPGPLPSAHRLPAGVELPRMVLPDGGTDEESPPP